MDALLITSLFIITLGYLVKRLAHYLGFQINEIIPFIFLLTWILFGYISNLDFSDAVGCIIGMDTNNDTRNIIFAVSSFSMILLAFKMKNKRIKQALISLELISWIVKLIVFKGGYAIGFGGSPSYSIVFYDLIALSVRLYIIIQILEKVQKSILIKVAIISLLIIGLKITFFPFPII